MTIGTIQSQGESFGLSSGHISSREGSRELALGHFRYKISDPSSYAETAESVIFTSKLAFTLTKVCYFQFVAMLAAVLQI